LRRSRSATLIDAELFASGIPMQCLGFRLRGVGTRLPVMMGLTFASVALMLSIATNPDLGLLDIHGAVVVARVFGLDIFPYTSLSWNVGLVGQTGVCSRFVTAGSEAIILRVGLIPKFATLVEAIPQVLVAATRARVLAKVENSRYRIRSTWSS
jgi:xanthine/uracil permease